jgi:hypothetical protein
MAVFSLASSGGYFPAIPVLLRGKASYRKSCSIKRINKNLLMNK